MLTIERERIQTLPFLGVLLHSRNNVIKAGVTDNRSRVGAGIEE
jgi:hypothetical protein